MARRSNSYRRFDSESSQPITASRLLIALTVFSLLISLPLLVNTVSRVQAETRMRVEYERLEQQVAIDEKCLAQLSDAVAFAKTDAFTEQWARERERLGKAGETVIVPANTGVTVQAARPWWEQRVDCKTK
jgi:uncharacterized coiled-coil protein SlyX